MAYYLDLFSPETYEAFAKSDRTISGFRLRQRNLAERIKSGNKFICYMTRLSRWVGILEVADGPFIDEIPIFYPENDPFIVRSHVQPLVWLPVEKAIPIHEDRVWNELSFTRGQSKHSSTWTGKLRGSLVRLDDVDGAFLERLIREQIDDGETYPVDPDEFKKLATHRVRREDGDVTVSVPEETDIEEPGRPEVRESAKIQALLAEVGSRMGMQIWVPRSDRAHVLAEWGEIIHRSWSGCR